MIFDGVVCASGENFGDVFPSISKCGMKIKEDSLLLKCPRRAGDAGGQLVIPPELRPFLPLSNLFRCAGLGD
jgi:hypothetical protein